MLLYLSFIIVFPTCSPAFPEISCLFCLFASILGVVSRQGPAGTLSLPPSTSQAPSLEKHTAKGKSKKGDRREKKIFLDNLTTRSKRKMMSFIIPKNTRKWPSRRAVSDERPPHSSSDGRPPHSRRQSTHHPPLETTHRRMVHSSSTCSRSCEEYSEIVARRNPAYMSSQSSI